MEVSNFPKGLKGERVKKETASMLKKKEVVAEIEKRLESAKSVIFMDYKGLTVAEANDLRNKFRDKGVTYKVYKNTLFEIALKNKGIEVQPGTLTGTLSVAFSNEDEISAAKIILGEKYKDKMAFKFGYLGNSFLDAAGVQQLATLPSKEQLIAQLMGLLQSGARNIASVVQAVPRNLAIVINEGSKKSA